MDPSSLLMIMFVAGTNVICFGFGLLAGRHHAYKYVKPYDLADSADPRCAKPKCKSKPCKPKN